MKKVRFESPARSFTLVNMNDRDCHSPRPLIEHNFLKPIQCALTYSSDPVRRFEYSDSSPYPLVNKTQLQSEEKPNWSPSSDLDLSLFDSSYHEPRRPMFFKSILKTVDNDIDAIRSARNDNPSVLSSIENKTPPNVLSKDNDFFLRKGSLNKFTSDINPLQTQFNRLVLDKENTPRARKLEIMQSNAFAQSENNANKNIQLQPSFIRPDGRCQQCIKTVNNAPSPHNDHRNEMTFNHMRPIIPKMSNNSKHTHCHWVEVSSKPKCAYCEKTVPLKQCAPFICNSNPEGFETPKINAVDKKTWAIEKFEQTKKSDRMEVEKQTNVIREKREPTVSDLLKIIKLQNEQLQLLQEKVDKLISAQNGKQCTPTQNCSEHMSIETANSEQHKISIGVMTSFEMVRTSTIINKEILKTNDNAHIQCNMSQISIKEVVSKTPNFNILEGIPPVENTSQPILQKIGSRETKPLFDGNEEKTLNELSLFNVQVDNATTPLMSPDQSLYLDIRDYSDSEVSSDDQSNVGWTYYNKVMTHVNGMLHDSDMPSSASALYRNTHQQMHTVQMQIDKTNLSVTKRVKFGDDPLGVYQPHIYAASTDTSLKMNQLAAKYLNNGPPIVVQPQPAPKPISAPIDMSFATRNYMETHKLLPGTPSCFRSPPPRVMPKFLDITALKQQPKLL